MSSPFFKENEKKIRGNCSPDLFIDFWFPFIPTFPINYEWGQGLGSHPL